MRKFLASVGNAQLLVKKDSKLEHFADVRTLTESTLGFSTTMEEVRAGEGAQLYGRFAHDSGMTVTLTDAMFDIRYIAAQVGGEVATNDKVYGMTTTTKGVGSDEATNGIVLSDIEDLGVACGLNHKVAWIKSKGCETKSDDNKFEWKAIVLGDDKTIPGADLAAYKGGNVCIRYFISKPGDRVMVSSNFIPSEFVLLLTTKLFAGDSTAPETGKPVGEITVKIPRFQLDGQFDLSMAMSSAATVSLNGTALAVDNPDECEGKGIYAEIIQVLDNNSILTNLTEVLADYDNGGINPTIYGLYGASSVSQIGSSNYVTKGDYVIVYDSENKDKIEALSTPANEGWILENGNRIGFAALYQ